jgi:hypothetical protein
MEDDLPNSCGTHQYLSFSANSKAGLYTTMYYAPTIPNLTARHESSPAGDGDPMMLVGPGGNGPPIGMRVMQAIWPLLRWIVPYQV